MDCSTVTITTGGVPEGTPSGPPPNILERMNSKATMPSPARAKVFSRLLRSQGKRADRLE